MWKTKTIIMCGANFKCRTRNVAIYILIIKISYTAKNLYKSNIYDNTKQLLIVSYQAIKHSWLCQIQVTISQ